VISSIGISSQKKNGKEKAFTIPAEAFLPESKNAFFHYILFANQLARRKLS
jgi:hypothetical protein